VFKINLEFFYSEINRVLLFEINLEFINLELNLFEINLEIRF